MSKWVLKGLQTGVKTTRYPDEEEPAPGVSPGLPGGGEYPEAVARSVVSRCPTEALSRTDHHVTVSYRRCVHCFRCAPGAETPLDWQPGYEWAALMPADVDRARQLGTAFGRSLHILVVDAGDCGACLNEIKQLNNPYYNMHRLGFFLTPTPRNADVLLVIGPIADHMRLPLKKAYEAMPPPRRVVAVGACALSGGVFGPSFVSAAGASDLLPVDVMVPGCPPPPLAILHGLLVAVGRTSSASLISPEDGAKEVTNS